MVGRLFDSKSVVSSSIAIRDPALFIGHGADVTKGGFHAHDQVQMLQDRDTVGDIPDESAEIADERSASPDTELIFPGINLQAV